MGAGSRRIKLGEKSGVVSLVSARLYSSWVESMHRVIENTSHNTREIKDTGRESPKYLHLVSLYVM